MHHSHDQAPICTNANFEASYWGAVKLMLGLHPIQRGPAHAMKDKSTAFTHEIGPVTETFAVDQEQSAWAEVVKPNLPWAEDHFQERIGGRPLNPSPSEAWWPFARQGNAEHKKDQKFSHTYPERFWPKRAGLPEDHCPNPEACFVEEHHPNWGIRFKYGDLSNLISILKKNPMSRQAYLPIWFPEDLTAADAGERVPCSMGYHFLSPGSGLLDCVYTMRSCDIVRFYRDDVYMAGRLLQHVASTVELALAQQGAGSAAELRPNRLIVHIDNLHCFPGDRDFLLAQIPKGNLPKPKDPRANYNWDAL